SGEVVNGIKRHQSSGNTSRFYSPLVKNIAREENIGVDELETISVSGAEGRVTKKDILNYGEVRKTQGPVKAEAQPAATTQNAGTTVIHASVSAGDEIIEMDRMRRMIADRMVDSKRIAPHVTSFVEADVTNIVLWRSKVKSEFQRQSGDALTYTPIFIEAVAK